MGHNTHPERGLSDFPSVTEQVLETAIDAISDQTEAQAARAELDLLHEYGQHHLEVQASDQAAIYDIRERLDLPQENQRAA